MKRGVVVFSNRDIPCIVCIITHSFLQIFLTSHKSSSLIAHTDTITTNHTDLRCFFFQRITQINVASSSFNESHRLTLIFLLDRSHRYDRLRLLLDRSHRYDRLLHCLIATLLQSVFSGGFDLTPRFSRLPFGFFLLITLFSITNRTSQLFSINARSTEYIIKNNFL